MTHLFLTTALFLLQSDADGAAAPVAKPGSAILEMLQNSGPVAIGVLAVLLIASLWSWAIILGKWGAFRRADAQSRRFLRAFRKATRLQEIATVSEQFKPSPLVNVFDEVYETYRRQTGGYGPPRNITALERAAQTAASESLSSIPAVNSNHSLIYPSPSLLSPGSKPRSSRTSPIFNAVRFLSP